MPLNYLTCEKDGTIEMQHNNNNNNNKGDRKRCLLTVVRQRQGWSGHIMRGESL